ncbi:DUF7553 family protein [Halorarum halobium]|uniref:DUF7553 family protein n=1 Tax=Halorarum halobium TaxID=3075121 RepID=UPI0028A9F454|nr:hypothetical protein [Halobaculum sp. XH14]
MVDEEDGQSEGGRRPGRALEELDRAAAAADAERREQLRSIEEGFREIVGGEATADAAPHADRIEELEEKLAALAGRTDGEVNRRINTAEALIAGYWRDVSEE